MNTPYCLGKPNISGQDHNMCDTDTFAIPHLSHMGETVPNVLLSLGVVELMQDFKFNQPGIDKKPLNTGQALF